MLLETLGKRIRSRREKLGLKQQDIASALLVSPQAVSKWERGENGPDIAILGALAKLLGVTTDWLLDTHNEGLDVFDATVLATSVCGAYEKSLTMEPRDFALWANGLFGPLTEAVQRFDGVPVKYLGDQFLAFFSGTDHSLRATCAALLAKNVITEDLRVGLSTGRIYLGAVGHADYARPDIMGQVVNIAFLTVAWAETGAASGFAATGAVADAAAEVTIIGAQENVDFKGIEHPVRVCELIPKQ